MAAGLLVPLTAGAARHAGLSHRQSYVLGGLAGAGALVSAELHPRTGQHVQRHAPLASPTCCPLDSSQGQLGQLGRPFSNISCVLAGGCLGLALVVKLTSATLWPASCWAYSWRSPSATTGILAGPPSERQD